MALVKCKECGHEISDSAYFCPNCGYADVDDSYAEYDCDCERKGSGGKIVLGVCCAALIAAAGIYGYYYFYKPERLKKTVEKGKKALRELDAMARSQPTIKKLISQF